MIKKASYLAICLLAGITANACALPAHPYFITLGGGSGYNDWDPITGHANGEPGGFSPGGADVFQASPVKAGGFDGLITAGLGLELSKHFRIQADYFYFTPSKVHFKGYTLYPEYSGVDSPAFTTKTQAGDLAMRFSINLLKKYAVGAYVGAGVGLVHRKDILADKSRFGGNFSAGLTHAFNNSISADLGMSYFTGYDESVTLAAKPYIPFLYGAHLNVTYNFG